MTVAADVISSGATQPSTNWVVRLWRSPLRWHAGLLLIAMAAIGAFLGVHSSFTDDEANVVLQSQAIAHGHWALPDPFPQVDPTHSDFAVENVTYSQAGFAPLGKHLTYTALVAPLVGLAGSAGLMALSMLGTVVAALTSARLARLYGTGYERAAFWVTGAASPLFFYGFVYTGQTVAAAAVGASMVAAFAYLRSGRPTTLIGAGLAMGVAVAARDEAMIWCIAVLLASPLLGRLFRGRPGFPARRVVALALVLPASGMAIRVLDVSLDRRLLGSLGPLRSQASAFLGGNTVTDQLRGFFIAVAGPGQGQDQFSLNRYSVLAVTVAGLALTALAARMVRNREATTVVSAVAALAALCFVIRTCLEPTAPVAGLLPAFPLVWATLWLVGRSEVRSPEARWAVGSVALFVIGVGMNVFSDGGGLQWGGRYLGLSLPVLIPLLIAGIGRYAQALSRNARRALAICAVVATGATGWQMLAALTASHRAGTSAIAELALAAPAADPGDSGKPVVVSTSVALGQLWDVYPDYRMLRVANAADLAELGARLRAAGVRRIILADKGVADDEAALSGSYRQVDAVRRLPSLGSWTTAVLAAVPG